MKLNKFKSLLAFLLVCGLTVSAASCGGETSTSDSSTQSSESVADSSSDSADSSSDSSAEQPDTTAPVITYADGKKDSYTMVSGEKVTLPSATAADEKDGAVDVDVSVTSKGASIVKTEAGYEFSSTTAGTYQVSYYAVDEAENETEEFISVTVTPIVPETTLEAGAGNIENLKEGKTYVENFENGYSGALAKGFSYSTEDGTPQASIQATADSIAGNSLIIDYTTCAWNTNTQFWFGTLDEYIKSGKWTISMDVKVLGGAAPSGIYLSFIYDGDNSGENQQFALGAVGETKTVTLTGNKTFDPSKTWHFRTFFYTGDSSYSYANFKLAIDNISITVKEVVDDTVERTGTPKTLTFADIDGKSYTLTGADDNYTALSGAMQYLDKSKVVASERLTQEEADNLTADNGFTSDYIIEANTQIVTFDALKNVCTDSTYEYTISFKVYSKNASGWHIFMTDGSGAQSGAKSMPAVTGPTTFTHTFVGSEKYVNIGLYNGSIAPLYIGDITIGAAKRQDTEKSPNGYEVGKTWTKDASALNLGNKVTAVKCSEITLADNTKLSDNAGFENNAVHFSKEANSTMELFRPEGTIEIGCTYEITFCLYLVSCPDKLMINIDNNAFVDILANQTGYKKVTITWKATKDADYFSLYLPSAAGEFYLASMSYKLTKLA